MKKITFLIIITALFSLNNISYSQTYTLEECTRLAISHYPTIKEFEHMQQSEDYNLSMINMAFFPQLSFEAKATYQTDVPNLPIEMPGFSFPRLSKDNYGVNIAANQLIWDGGLTKANANIIKANTKIKTNELEVEIFELKTRVQNIYFAILLINEQLAQQKRIAEELELQLGKVNSYIENGILGEKDADIVRVEQLRVKQNTATIEQSKTAYLQMLSYLTGEKIDDPNSLIVPDSIIDIDYDKINRPEINLLNAQYELFGIKEYNIKIKSTPNLGFFVQGGYGRPGLNYFENEFKFYAHGGVRLAWNFGNLYSIEDERKEYKLQKENIKIQEEKFLFNLDMRVIEIKNNIAKYNQLLKYDQEIINLREELKKSAEIEVENGTLSISDLLDRVFQLELAKQNLYQHRLKKLIEILTLKQTLNN
ncbi:MAG: TolC family protein [Bacteroidales bacterium]|jgi:outer membrane protein TolC